MVNHCLNIDADERGENVAGVGEHNEPTEECECGDKTHQRISKLAGLQTADDWQDEKRSGAELEWEGVPLVIPGRHATAHVKAVNELFVHFKQEHYCPTDPDNDFERFFRAMFLRQHHAQNTQCDEYAYKQ